MYIPRIILIPSTAYYYSGNYSRTIGSGLLERLPLLLPWGQLFLSSILVLHWQISKYYW